MKQTSKHKHLTSLNQSNTTYKTNALAPVKNDRNKILIRL